MNTANRLPPFLANITKGLLLTCMILVLISCAGVNTEDEKISAHLLYQQAQEALADKNFILATEKYEKLEVDHPFSAENRQGQIDIFYAYYKAEEPDSAIVAANRFIKLYPRHPKVDYAYYIRALVNFNRTRGTLDDMFKLDPAIRDPHTAEESFQNFVELIERFPDSIYRDDAIQRMVHLRNYLARHELYVARYYLKLQAYVAAVNRSKFIIENYAQSPSILQALDIMAQAYQELGLNDLAAQTRLVLKTNLSTPSEQERFASDDEGA